MRPLTRAEFAALPAQLREEVWAPPSDLWLPSDGPTVLDRALTPSEVRDLYHYGRPPLAGGADATLKTVYAVDEDVTITLASLASSASLVAGREGTAISNATNQYLDYLINGEITVGTTPTEDTFVEVWIIGQSEDAPAYPDVFDGTDSDETVTAREILLAAGRQAAQIHVGSTTSDRKYPFASVSLLDLFGAVPERWTPFVVHDTGVALNATGGNHFIRAVGVHSLADEA